MLKIEQELLEMERGEEVWSLVSAPNSTNHTNMSGMAPLFKAAAIE
jgi:hypothetical protein